MTDHDIPQSQLPTPTEARAAEVAFEAAEETLHPHDAAAEAAIVKQMDVLYTRDRWWAIGFMIALLITLPFILIVVWNVVPEPGIRWVLVAAAAMLVLYNGGSIAMLLRNYERDREFIYRRDVAHLQELRAARAELRAARRSGQAKTGQVNS